VPCHETRAVAAGVRDCGGRRRVASGVPWRPRALVNARSATHLMRSWQWTGWCATRCRCCSTSTQRHRVSTTSCLRRWCGGQRGTAMALAVVLVLADVTARRSRPHDYQIRLQCQRRRSSIHYSFPRQNCVCTQHRTRRPVPPVRARRCPWRQRRADRSCRNRAAPACPPLQLQPQPPRLPLRSSTLALPW
jgi:hypothetical protein